MAANPEILSRLKAHIETKTGGGDPPVKGGEKPKPAPPPTDRIPLPDYKDPQSRLAFAKAFRQKYGKDVLNNYGDIPLRSNEKAFWASDTSKNLTLKLAKQYNIDPAILYSSAMIEGMSGLYPDENNTVKAWTGNKEYPVSGAWNFGLDSFQDKLPELQKKGYLPADFQNNFTVGRDVIFKDPTVQATLFKNTDAGYQAKAAMLKNYYDELDDYAKKKGVSLNPNQRNFFALAHFNSGAHGYEMLDAYNKAGLLKDDSFINKMPNIPIEAFNKFYKGDAAKAAALHKLIYGNVAPRLAAARGLTEEGLLAEPPAPATK